MKVLETAVKQLKLECERAQKLRFQVRLTLLPKAQNNVINNIDFNLATKKAATKQIKQAVAELIRARLEKLQDRLDEITTKRHGTKKGVSERDPRMKRGSFCQRG